MDVKVVMTQSALAFIQPLTLSTLSQSLVYSNLFEQEKIFSCEHIELAKWADAILIAPATANTLAKLAHGLADDLLSTICLASQKPLYLAPAMNQAMWENSITQENLERLKNRGCHILEPATGEQACGDIGIGRMLSPEMIIDHLLQQKQKLFFNQHIVITAGPTIEAIDPVRFMSNHSSGQMGYAIAQAAIQQSARVTLISGPTHLAQPSGCFNYVRVNSALEMYEASMQHAAQSDVFIATAAVADYRVEKIALQKIKKTKDFLTLKLIKNPDIISAASRITPRPFIVGFAAETENMEHHASQKMHEKNMDLIAANLVGQNCGFNQPDNALLLLSKSGQRQYLEKKSKQALANELMAFIHACLI